MEILNYPCKLQAPCAVALGRFDGVHIAHKRVISASKQEGLLSVVFTFCDNPNKTDSPLLTTEKEKQQLIKDCGADILVNATFDSVRNMTAEEFVRDVLLKNLNARVISCGYNYRFAKGASADVNTLQALCKKYDITLVCVDETTSADTSVSSTAIRTKLLEGDLDTANKLLGRRYSIAGTIVHGNAIGRTINTPTLNLDADKNKLLPAFGVYATYAHIDGKVLPSVTNIGKKPTVGSDTPTIETYLLDTEGNFYGKECTIELVKFLRREQKFQSLDELKNQIAKDIENAKATLT